MDREKYGQYKANLSNLTEHEIKGGNHAGFGMYGRQDGDGEAVKTSAEQIKETVEQISLFVK